MHLWAEIWGTGCGCSQGTLHALNQGAQKEGGTELRLQHQLGPNPGPTMAQLYDLGQVTEPQPHLEMG